MDFEAFTKWAAREMDCKLREAEADRQSETWSPADSI
jgi:hypothetical protein